MYFAADFGPNAVLGRSNTYSASAISVVTITGSTTGAALHENKEATAKSTSQDGGMAVNFG